LEYLHHYIDLFEPKADVTKLDLETISTDIEEIILIIRNNNYFNMILIFDLYKKYKDFCESQKTTLWKPFEKYNKKSLISIDELVEVLENCNIHIDKVLLHFILHK